MTTTGPHENLLQQLRQAMREVTLAQEARKRARRELRKIEARVREARRHLRLVEQAIPRAEDPATCETCHAPIGSTTACLECSAHRTIAKAPREGAI